MNGLNKLFYSGLLWIGLDHPGLLSLRSELWRTQSSEVFGDSHFAARQRAQMSFSPIYPELVIIGPNYLGSLWKEQRRRREAQGGTSF